MRIGILTIGNELITGKTQDTNSSFIARELDTFGWPVAVFMSVPDEDDAIRSALEHILARAEAVIVTGGLGPTADDITTAAVARAFGLGLSTDEKCLRHIRGLFASYRLPWTENNAKQAVFPDGAETIVNPVGTAWGFSVQREGKLVIVIPGVPREVERMIPDGVIPRLRAFFPGEAPRVAVRTIKLFGIPEAKVDEAVADLDFASRGVSIGFYPRFPENHVVLTARHADQEKARESLAWAEARVEERLRTYVIAHDEETLEVAVADLMKRQGLTLAVAESCTGGLITDRLTDVPGSSAFLERGIVAYGNRTKTELLGVPEPILREHGAVSEPTARLMAEGARRLARTDLGLSVTGIAGPTGGSDGKPVGTVFVAVTDGTNTVCRGYQSRWDRRRTKVIASEWALRLLRRHLIGGEDHE